MKNFQIFETYTVGQITYDQLSTPLFAHLYNACSFRDTNASLNEFIVSENDIEEVMDFCEEHDYVELGNEASALRDMMRDKYAYLHIITMP